MRFWSVRDCAGARSNDLSGYLPDGHVDNGDAHIDRIFEPVQNATRRDETGADGTRPRSAWHVR